MTMRTLDHTNINRMTAILVYVCDTLVAKKRDASLKSKAKQPSSVYIHS